MSGAESVDLDAATREALEWDRVLDEIASLAATPEGAGVIRGFLPRTSQEWLDRAHQEVEECRRSIAEDGSWLAPGLPATQELIPRLAVQDAVLEARELRDLALVLERSGALGANLRRLPAEDYPALRRLAAEVPDLRGLADPILEAVEPDGALRDEASETLASLRQRQRQTAASIQRMLERRLRGPEARGVIRDAFVTQRSGRFVIPVRTDAPRRVEGIVHAASASGQTLFVEPVEVVEANNALVELHEAEREEIRRLLAAWSAGLRAVEDEVKQSLDFLCHADTLQARARFGEAHRGCRPRFEAGARLSLRGVRHPLLESRLREENREPVPLDLERAPDTRVVVISGPNMGGKTVALKTLGVAVLLAQSGVPVPASEAVVPRFRQIRADIGDHQSIQASLSTFAAHVGAVAAMLRDLREPALVLLDEPGTGTEPHEGAALARALLEHLAGREVLAAASTHFGSLKTWALAHPQVASLAMDFDPDTLEPTYRVVPGLAGVSAGLVIAERLGLPRELLARARALLRPEEEELQRALARLRERWAELETARRALAEREEALRLARAEVEEARRQAEEREARRWRRALERAVRRVEQDAEQRLARLAGRLQEDERRVLQEQLRREIRRSARVAEAEAAQATAPSARRRPASIRPGTAVHVPHLRRDGVVERVEDGAAWVRVGPARVRVALGELREASGRIPAAPRAAVAAAAPADPPSTGALELNLIGLRVDEALEALDRFLDRAMLQGLGEVRVIHGYGTGRLRQAVREHLRDHPAAASHRPGTPEEGGDGATVVRLAG